MDRNHANRYKRQNAIEFDSGFYVPRVRIMVGDTEVEGVESLTYTDSVNDETNAFDHFEFSVNNWDPIMRKHRYIGSETADDLTKGATKDELTRFEPSTKPVTVEFGYSSDLTLFMVGLITNMQPRFPSSGAPSLTVSGVNSLYRLRDKQHTWAWEKMTDSAIAKDLATNPRGGQGKFPYKVHVRSDQATAEEERAYLAQNNQYDIDFLFRRARELGYTIVAFDSKAKHGPPATHLYFGPAERFPGDLPPEIRNDANHATSATTRSETPNTCYRLAWGKSLVEIAPTIATNQQVHSVVVHGWDRRKKAAFTESVQFDDKQLGLSKEMLRIIAQTPPTTETVTDEPVFSHEEAKKKAFGIIRNQQKLMVTVKAKTVGLPDLRAGKHVELADLGVRLSGKYLVTSTTHTFDSSGYMTSFDARLDHGATK